MVMRGHSHVSSKFLFPQERVTPQVGFFFSLRFAFVQPLSSFLKGYAQTTVPLGEALFHAE